MTSIVTWMTSLIAGLVGLCLPLGYFAISYSNIESALKTEVQINAHIVTGLINANPDMWRYEELRLSELLRQRPGKRTPEVRSIRDLDGELLVESGPVLERPLLTRAEFLRDAGRKVGTIEISRSLRPLLERTGALMLLGALFGFLGIITLRNIPLRRLRSVMAALHEEKERAQITLSSIGDGVITTDAQGKVQLLNGVAERLTGWMQEEASGRHLSEVFCIVDERTRASSENPAERVLRERRAVELANGTVLLAKDGAEHIIADSGAPIRDADGNITGVVLVFRDVTDKRKHRDEMQRADKLESIGVLAGGIAHDFNNFLSQIMGNISMAQLSPSCDDELLDLLARADKACVHAQDLTRQLLTFAKGGMPVKEVASLGELIRTSVEFALTGSAVRAEVHIADDLPPVNIDSGQINQVLNNLVINALEAMPDGGVITVAADRILLGENDVSHLPAGVYTFVSVQDRGAGIAHEVLPRIFDPYFTTKQRGSGLGLATCYSIIKKHDGHIEVLSEPGKGSLFRFYLPALSAFALPERQPPADAVLFGRGRVLLMDDDELIRTTAMHMLTRLGYAPICAKDGAEAIYLYRNAMESAAPFCAVILDLTIPGAMGGRETIQRLRELDAGVKAIVSSGYSEDPVMGAFAKYGFCDVLGKPYDLKQLSRVLHRVVGRDPQR